jgi:hypothetical protein
MMGIVIMFTFQILVGQVPQARISASVAADEVSPALCTVVFAEPLKDPRLGFQSPPATPGRVANPQRDH